MSLNHLNSMYSMLLNAAIPIESALLAVPVSSAERIRFYLTSDYSTFSVLSTAPNSGTINTFSNDGSLFVVGNGAMAEKFHIWQTGLSPDASTWVKLTAPATQPSAAITDVEFSPNGEYMAVAIEGAEKVIIYETSTWTALSSLTPDPTDANQLSWSADSSKLAVVGVLTTALYNIPSMTRIGNISQTVREVAFHPYESNFVSGLAATPWISAYDSTLVALSPALPAASGNLFDGESVCFAMNGSTLISASNGVLSPVDRPLTIYDWSTKAITYQPALNIIQGRALTVNSNQMLVAALGTDAGGNFTIDVVKVTTGGISRNFTPADLMSGNIAFSPY